MRRPRPEPALRPPSLLFRRGTGLLVLVLLIIPFLVPIPQELRRNPVVSPLGDQLHIVLLAAMTMLLYWRGPLTGRLLPAALTAAAIGGGIELLQEPFGRQANWGDFSYDLVGIGLAVGWVGWRGLGRRAGLALMVLLVLAAPYQLRHVPFLIAAARDAEGKFPVIADLESRHDLYLWSGNSAEVTREKIPDAPDGEGHVIRLAAEASELWPAAEMKRFPHDWSEYDTLALDVRLVSGPTETQRFGVRLDDFLGRREMTWIVNRFFAERQWQTFRVPIRDRLVTTGKSSEDRIFDLTDVDLLLIYLSHPKEPVVLEIDNVRLE